MEKSYEKQYLVAEKTHPWFIVRRALVYSLLSSLLSSSLDSSVKISKKSKILDYGCGSGQLLQLLKEKGFKDLQGYEPSKEAHSKNVKYIKKLKKYDIIFMLDVLEHIKDEKKAISKISSLLNKGGTLILSVPAFMFLWSKHDEVNQHYRRYNKKILRKAFKNSPLKIRRLFYWNSIFFLPAVLLKKLNKSKSEIEDSGFLGIFLKIALKIENTLIKLGINLPFGTSLFAILTKD